MYLWLVFPIPFVSGGAIVCLAGTQLVRLDQHEPHSTLNERLVSA